eukprot:CAMPEP_0172365276 /NCGR_PEP_ID=MMETSP1060-20121228/8203_1 /TAXON_ID=37318 /ORGANISM="Pseudo-nitzschia pungens, Strain cf. cingulata" /LENGTH=818 /DNA_ID=CAMNT_0013088493 /DNA_START=387 /DNA_END=2843 /DNA_ORIENTATION=-
MALSGVTGSALLALGLGCLLLLVPLAREGGTSSEVAVWNLRTSVTIQLVTGLFWIVVALCDDSSHSEGMGFALTLAEEARFRSTRGLLVVGFAVFVMGCASMMASFWPVGVGVPTATTTATATEERSGEARRDVGDLTEPLLQVGPTTDETTGVETRPADDGESNFDGDDDEECGDSPPSRQQDEDDPIHNNNEDGDEEEPDDPDSHNDEDNHDHDHHHTDTSRIQGTRRLLAVAAPQVVYLYVGCITLLVRLPFSLSIPHFVSTTLGALAEGSYSRARKEITWLFVLGTIDAVLDFWCIFWFGYANQRIVRDIRIDTFLSILKQDIGFFDGQTSGELASRLNSDCGEMAGDLTWFFRFSIESVVRITGITAYMLLRSPRLGACAISIVPLVATVNNYYGKWLSDNAARVQDALAAANSVAQETLGCIRTIVAFASEEFEHNKYKERIDEQYRLNIRQTYIQGVYYMFVSTFLINTIVQGTLLLVGSVMIQRGMLTSEILLAFMLYQGQLQNEMMNLFNSYSSLVKSTGAGDKIFELLDRKPPAPGTGSRQVQLRLGGTVPLTDESVGIRFESVRFSYPSRPDQHILRGMDFDIPAGSTFALVGPSGCGKSTIVNLLLRFYDPSSGRILIDGEDVRSYDLKHHRQRIGIVTQDPVLFSGTILSNIVYGMPNATMAEAIEAAERANAHEFISAFPDGYDTQVGERGLQLSGGQKQRIAISRAIIRHPSLLLLDEATSALDAESELLVQRSIDGLLKQSKSTTTIIVAHRLRTVRNADCIAVINEGRIVEMGSHKDLMSLENGYYRGIIDKSMGDKIAIE